VIWRSALICMGNRMSWHRELVKLPRSVFTHFVISCGLDECDLPGSDSCHSALG